jgi:NAD(P)-dependent dehydrogenase (short-subunit alcohol dehydrogenase family)
MSAGRMQGVRCLIVGGTSGIGLASARRFLEEGARVVIAGRSDETGEAALGTLESLGSAWFVGVDLRDGGSVDHLFNQALGHLEGRLDVLFHVAGVSGRRFGDGPLHECTEDGWDAVLDTNARGLFLTNRAAVRRMLAQDLDAHGQRGAVLNMGSVLAASPSPTYFGTLAYAASKGAIRALTRAAAARYAPQRIRFNLIAPALIATPMAARAAGDPAIRAYLRTKQPMAEGPGTPEDCAEAALFLCAPAARFVTGVELAVDGGWCVSEGQHPGADEATPAPEA